MRYLVDANLSHHIAGTLSDAGFEASHVVDGHLWNASDEVIAEHAIAHGQTIISADSDFATNLALRRGTAPSLVLLRSMDRLTPAEQAAVLIANSQASRTNWLREPSYRSASATCRSPASPDVTHQELPGLRIRNASN